MSLESTFDPWSTTKLQQEFDLGDSIGRGGFGRVIKARRICDDNEFAIKIIKFEPKSKFYSDLGKIRREANVLAQLNHNNIVRYYNSWVETANVPRSKYEKLKKGNIKSEVNILSKDGYMNDTKEEDEEATFIRKFIRSSSTETNSTIENRSEDSTPESEDIEIKYLFIQMELCKDTTLREVIRGNLYLNDEKITKYFRQICEGLSYIHAKNIVHRDLKPANIFLTNGGIIKIGDFGLSKQVSRDTGAGQWRDETPAGSLSQFCGTEKYTAPEIYGQTATYISIKADIYSLGIVYFEMCSNPSQSTSVENLRNVTFPFNDSEKKSLIRSMLHQNDDKRPTCDEILKILKSDKVEQEIHAMIKNKNKDKNKVSREQFIKFASPLRKNKFQEQNLATFFTTTAVKIFELHGAMKIETPVFHPPFHFCLDYLTTLVNSFGNLTNLTAVSKNSRLPFCWFLLLNDVRELRTYSIGKKFQESEFSPNEMQECTFRAVSTKLDDFVNDAEALYIVKEICDNIFTKDDNQIVYYINHSDIFSQILTFCEIEDVTIFTNVMINFWKNCQMKELNSTFSHFQVEESKSSFILELQAIEIEDAEREMLTHMSESVYLAAALHQLKMVIQYAVLFGVKKEDIIFAPLLITDRNTSGFMFKAVQKQKQNVIATGERFDSLIEDLSQKYAQTSASVLSAVEVAFDVEVVSKILTFEGKFRSVDILIQAEDKSVAIPLMKELLAKDIRCEITSELAFADLSKKGPLGVLELLEEDKVKLNVVKQITRNRNTSWKFVPVLEGNWKTRDLLNIISKWVLSFKTANPKNVSGAAAATV